MRTRELGEPLRDGSVARRRVVAGVAAMVVWCTAFAASPVEARAVPTAGVPGTLDTTWSGDGIATLQTKYQPATRGLPGGRLAVGLYKDGDGGAFRLWKLDELGGPLATYGDGLIKPGYVKRSFAPGGVNFPGHVLNYGTDQVVVGSYYNSTVARLGVARLREDGTYKVIGSTPGRNIYKVFANEHDDLWPFAAGVLGNGRLMVAVAAFRFNSAGDLVYMGQAIIKLNNNGSLDRTFSGDGVLPVAKDVGDITFGPDGSVFLGRVVGSSHEIRKFTPTGAALDPTFSGDGKYLVPCGPHHGADLEADSSGRVLVTCDRVGSFPFTIDLRLIRVTPEGILDPTYSGNGMAPLQLMGDSDNFAVHVEESEVSVVYGSGQSMAMYVYTVDATGEQGCCGGVPTALPAHPDLLDLAITDGRLIAASARGTSYLDLIAVSI